jgi:hypothetical protein
VLPRIDSRDEVRQQIDPWEPLRIRLQEVPIHRAQLPEGTRSRFIGDMIAGERGTT